MIIKINKLLSVFVSLSFLVIHCFAQGVEISEIKVESKVDKEKITVGDEITYTIAVSNIEDGEIQFPTALTSLGNFEIKDVMVEGNRAVYIMTVFKVGEDTIPPLTLKYTRDNSEYDIETEAIPIVVNSVLTPDIKDIRDIKPPLDIPLNKLPLILVLIGALIVGTALYFFIKKFKRQKTVVLEKEIRPAHEVAYERLRLMELDIRRIKEYYIELSDIIRRYIEARFGISAPTETTYELIDELKKRRVEYSNVNHMREFFEECDIVKFAKYVPSTFEIEEDTNSARLIVDKTRTKEEEIVEGDESVIRNV